MRWALLALLLGGCSGLDDLSDQEIPPGDSNLGTVVVPCDGCPRTAQAADGGAQD